MTQQKAVCGPLPPNACNHPMIQSPCDPSTIFRKLSGLCQVVGERKLSFESSTAPARALEPWRCCPPYFPRLGGHIHPDYRVHPDYRISGVTIDNNYCQSSGGFLFTQWLQVTALLRRSYQVSCMQTRLKLGGIELRNPLPQITGKHGKLAVLWRGRDGRKSCHRNGGIEGNHTVGFSLGELTVPLRERIGHRNGASNH